MQWLLGNIHNLIRLMISFFTLCSIYPKYRARIRHPRLWMGLFAILLLCFHVALDTVGFNSFYANTILLPALLYLYALACLDVSPLCSLYIILLLSATLNTLAPCFDTLFSMLPQNSIQLTYTFSASIAIDLGMLLVAFYLKHFALRHTEKPSGIFTLISCYTSLMCIFWGTFSFPEHFAETASVQWLRVLFSIGLLCLNLLIYYFYYRMNQQYQENLELKMKNQRYSMEAAANEEVSGLYQEIRKDRHDFLNHVGTMNVFLREKKYDELEKYFSTLIEQESSLVNYVDTGNIAVNTLLNRKANSLEGLHIPFSVDAALPDRCSISDIDLCSILSNLVDNASEAVQKQKNGHISLTISPVQGYLAIRCENSIEENILQTNPKLRTTKADPTVHGLGLKIIRQTVEKYNGMLDISTENGCFTVRIMVPMAD